MIRKRVFFNILFCFFIAVCARKKIFVVLILESLLDVLLYVSEYI